MDPLDFPQGEQAEAPRTPYDPKYSDRQVAVFDAVQDYAKPILIKAVAGSGKTTTIVKAMEFAPGSSLFLAFNRDIAEEIKTRLAPGSGEVRTINSLGAGMLWANRRSSELNARKSQDIIKAIMGEGELYKEFGWTLARAVGLAKNNAFGINSSEELPDFVQLIDAYLDIPFEKLEWAGHIVMKAFRASIGQQHQHDFDDQCYLPLRENWRFRSYSNVFVDECQDLSPIQHLMLERLRSYGARIVAVGDPYQAIYGFRGALTNSVELLKEKFQMEEFPLDISYRCARRIVEEAQIYCPDIRWRDNAPEGQVIHRDRYEGDPDDFGQQMVVSRNNAPMFRAILRYIRAKRPCQVKTNFLESFQSFIRSFKVEKTTELRAKLSEWYEKEKEAAEKKGFRGKLAGLQDKYETCDLLASEFKTCSEMLEVVKRLGESVSGTIFSTIHKAKGLEHDSVYILRPDTMPSTYARTVDQLQQENNLIYVAITRAKSQLTWGVRMI
jgi:DNA helicase II / ATP-dependent DNA helicase PcrA